MWQAEYLAVWFGTLFVLLFGLYAVVKLAVLSALREHERTRPAPRITSPPTPSVSAPRPPGYKGSRSLNFPDDKP